MCFPRKIKASQMKIFKQKFTNLRSLKKDLLSEGQLSNYYLQRLAFMEHSIQRDLTGMKKIIYCLEMPEIEGTQLFDRVFLQCALDEKFSYFQKALDVVRNAPDISEIVNLERVFQISVKNFVCWGKKQKAKINGLRLAIGQMEIDLRRYLLRESKSSMENSYVLEAIYPSKPEQLRFSFEDNKSLNQDIQLLMHMAEEGFKFMVEIWLKKPEKMDGRMSFSLLSAQRINPETPDKQHSFFGQSVDGNKKHIKKPQIKKFKFEQESQDEEKKQKKVHSEKGLPVHKLSHQKNLPTAPTLPEQSLSPRHFPSIFNYPASQNGKNLLKVLFPHYHIQQLETITGYFNLSSHKSKKYTLSLYKHRTENRIKARLNFLDIESEEVVKGILDYFKWSHWNEKVKRSDVLMKLESQNCVLSTLEWKNIKAPPFRFLSHLCQYRKNDYIGLKIYPDEAASSKDMRNSYFTAGIMKVSSVETGTQLFLDLYYENNASFSVQFINSICFLESYANQEGNIFNQILKFGWQIDKEMKNEFVDENGRRSNQYSYSSWEFGNIENIEEEKSFETINEDSSEVKNNVNR